MPAAKKLVNIFFSLVLIAGLLPVTAFASPDQGPEENANGKAVVVDQGDAGESASGSETVPSNSNEAGESNSPELDSAKLGNDSDSDGSQDVQGATSSQEDSDLENSWRYTNGVLTVQDDSNGVDMYSNDSSRAGKTAVRSGIDVSEHNGTIDWDKAKADGVDFAILRIGFIHDNGRGRSDYQWERNVSECERLGIPYGVYVYSYAETASHASTEADFVLQRLKGHNPSYPVYYDLEDNCQLSVAQNHGMGALAQTFCNKIAAAGYTPGVYANTNWWTNYLTDSCFGNWEKWVAQYNSSCTYKGNYSIWQYTSSGYVDGIDGRVDMNFDYEKDRAFDNSYRLEIAPKNVSAAASGSGEVTLSWDAVEGADAYAVAEYVDGGYRTFTTSCSATSYKVSGLSNGKRHGFLVQARVGGKWSAVSTDLLAYATPQGATKPEPKAEPGNGSVKLTWDKVPGASAYAVATRNADGSYKTYTLSCAATGYTVTGLTNGKSYDFLVQAKVDGAWTSFSSSDLVSAAPSDPTSPKNVSAAASGSGEVTLSWDAVEGADAYAVAEYVDGGYRTFTTSCSATSYKVSGLSNGKRHGFLVQARVGGKWSAVSTDLLAYATPQGATKPEPKAEPGNGSVKLTWDKVPGASAYAVATRNADGSYKTYTLSCAATGYTVTGLTNGKSYDFLVQAKVDGAWTSFSSSDLVSAAPSDPTSPKNVSAAASGSGEVTLSWDAVEGADAYAVAEYVDGGYRTFTTSCSATSYKVSGLSNGKRHGFLVQARVGGKWSAVSTDLLAYATPQGATKPEPKAEPGNGSVKLTWDKVPGATKYAVTREDTTTAVYIDGDSYEAKGLKNGTTYAFHVRALIDGSWTLLTDDAVCATPFSPAVPKVSASLDGEVVHLKWNEIPGADRYAVALKMGAEYKTYTYDCGQTEFTVKDLNPGAYTFLVQSHSDNGWSSFNDNDLVSITVPDANSPKVTVDYRDGDSIVLSWNPIPGATKYAVAECKNGSFSNFTTEYADTQFEIRNLGFGVKHRYLVQAYVNGSWNKFTESDYAEAFVSDKSSPDVMAVASADGQVTLSWEKVSGASKYAIAEYVEGGYRTFTTSCTDLSYVVNDLGNGHEHKFLVQAFVDGRWSVASADLLVSTTPHGVMAPAATAKAGDLSATLQWGRVPGATRYAVAAQNGDGSFTTYTYSCTGLSYTVKGLVSGRTYKMLVQAYVDGKWSPFSSVDLVSVKPYGTNVPTGQQMMSGIANGSGFTSNTSYLILVNRSRHEVGVFRGNFNNWSCIKFWSCVTGAPSTPTITGEYKTTGFKRTNLTTDARARWCTQINGGYFFHSILASNNELGSSQSHGCIRLAVENAKWIYDNIMQGTKVYIY